MHSFTRRAAVIALAASVAPRRPACAADTQVTIDNFSFLPAEVTVAAGATVTWTNRDDIPHTVTDAAHPRDVKSPPLDTGDAYSLTFASPGRYAYFCSLHPHPHPHMQGTVAVN